MLSFFPFPLVINSSISLALISRDESGAESFRLFRGKTETEGKYGNGNGILQNGNKYGNFLTEMETETETEQRFLVEHTRKRNFRFRLMRNFRFSVELPDPIQQAQCVTLSN